MDDAQMIIERLELTPHPEGGWYRETWRDGAGTDSRALVSCVVTPGFEFAGFTLAAPGWSPDA